MSKKKLLYESEIRRFQGLAGIPAISTEGYYKGARHEDEEEMEEGMHPDGARHEDEEEMEEGMYADGEREEEEMPMGDMEMDVEMDASDEGGDLDLSPEQKEDLAADIVRAVAQELSAALDLEEPIEVETDGGEDLEMDLGMGDDEEMDLEVGDEPPAEEEPEGMRYMEETEEPVEEAVEETIEETTEESIEESEELEESNNEELVNEVLRRVIARLSNK